MPASPNRRVALLLGVAYLVLGLVGFAVTAQVGFAAIEGGMLFGLLSLNPLHNLVHILLGAALVMAGSSGVDPSRTTNNATGTFLLVLGGFGVYAVGTTINILAINAADNALHFASAAVLLAAGLGTDRPVRAAA